MAQTCRDMLLVMLACGVPLDDALKAIVLRRRDAARQRRANWRWN